VQEGGKKQMETRVNQDESIDSALKRFRRQCQRDGVLAEIKKREYYEKPSVKRKKKALAARRRRS
jgi:small subunit ribosomal protein S21